MYEIILIQPSFLQSNIRNIICDLSEVMFWDFPKINDFKTLDLVISILNQVNTTRCPNPETTNIIESDFIKKF